MSPRLTNVSSKKAHRALKRLGFQDVHRRGSHLTMARENADGSCDTLVLVMSQKEINPFTLKGALDLGNVAVDEFTEAL